MPIVSLTTDYTKKEYHVGKLKGQLYSYNKDIIIVDINHQIEPFDVISASYNLKNAYTGFPDESIHIISVNVKDGNSRYLIAKKDSHYFILPDNGIITLMFPKEDFKAWVYSNLEKDFSYNDLHSTFPKIIDAIYKNEIERIAVLTSSYKVLSSIQAFESEDGLRGSICYIDSFENVVVNISKEMFEKYVADRSFIISFNHYKISEISKHYSDVPEGEYVAIFNDAGLLEIGINKGNASGLLHLKFGSLVMVEAFDRS